MADYVMTIDSDVEDAEEILVKPSKKGKGKGTELEEDGTALNPEFTFDLLGDPFADVLGGHGTMEDLVHGSKGEPISVDDIIARRKLTAGTRKRRREAEEDSDEGDGSSEGGSSDDDNGDSQQSDDPLATSDEGEDDDGMDDPSGEEIIEDFEDYGSSSGDDSEHETQAEKARKAAFFADDSENKSVHTSFLTMNLSRPILKALTALSFNVPTPIQAATIPVALLGKDVVGNAVTGSGKTAAFIIPVLERLLYRERGIKAAAVRCVVLVPTRELGVQCYDVGKKLAAHTDVRFSLIVGGLSLKSQEADLRTRPDIIVATPGRLIDHLRNSPTFALDTLDVLILDEADRMLSDGFADELKEIIQACPKSRQTMLFSATMTDSVDELVKMSLNKPVRLFVDPKRTTARGLIQEFVRVRAGKEAERSALLVSLCKRTFRIGVIVFLRSKKLAHQLRVVFGLLGMKCDELHGDLTQEQRLRALQSFRDGSVDFLMATDLASRGLDIKGIETVINYDMPGQLAQYLHRVGRTARAGKKGRSVTLVGEADRKMLKAAIKHSAGADQVRHRTIPPEYVSSWATKLDGLKDEIAEVLKEEKEEKALRQAEMEIRKGQNIIDHEEEIHSRPARTWFQSGKEKRKAEETSKKEYQNAPEALKTSKAVKSSEESKPKRDKFAGLSRKAKRRKLAMEEDDQVGENAMVKAAVRNAKKAARPTKIGIPEPRRMKPSKMKEKKKKVAVARKVTSVKGVFDRDMGEKSRNREGVRANARDSIGGMGKKKGGKRKGK
ncbi:DEAD-domain-containing protein [Rickenella mellea]|uniref:RNA helicase n=1 Tax=Rickenella mellea TaxID=50990 RepID=A0A4Y7QN25_9AGAM|nr:DEAD-domain-containing protein [Rickenella mellea]